MPTPLSHENVVITGVGVVSAIGMSAEDFFQGLLDRRSGVCSLANRTDGDARPPVSESDDEIDGVWIGAPITEFDAKQFVRPRKALKVMCREIAMAFASAQLAIDHAGLRESIPAADDGVVQPSRLGTVYGGEMFFSPPSELVDTARKCLDDSGTVTTREFGNAAKREVTPLWMLKYLPNMPACQVGIAVNSQGPNNTLVLGDVSGPASLLEAQSYLQRGIADTMLVGATGTKISATRLIYRQNLAFASVGQDDVSDASRPHDPDSVGVVGGEGAASLVVETATSAAGRGAKVYAKLLSIASRFAATDSMDATKERGARQAITLAVEAVLSDAGVSAAEIGLVVSHAMGDHAVDLAERKAIIGSGITAPTVAVSGALGHCGAASGMLGIAAGVLALESDTVPPTRCMRPSPDANLCQRPQELHSPFVLCVAHTTEGCATAVLLGKP